MIYIFEALLLALAVSLDAFASSFAYGAGGVDIPFESSAVIGLTCSFILGLSMVSGSLIAAFISPQTEAVLCFLLLTALGLSKIFDSAVKAFIKKHQGFEKKLRFSAGSLGFILSVYASPLSADSDCSKVLSPLEAIYLAIALSFDGFAVGIGAGMTAVSPVAVVACSLACTVAAIQLGARLGHGARKAIPFDTAWISGAMLICMAALRIMP